MENVRKWARDSNRLFSKEDIQTASRYVKKKKKKVSSSLVVRKWQSKITKIPPHF